MEDKRRSKRQKLDIEQNLKQIRQQGDKTEQDVTIQIHVRNISKSGIGFTAGEILHIGSYYNSDIMIQTGETVGIVVQIVRSKELGGGQYEYGGSFVGITDFERFKIETFRLVMETKETESL